MSAMLREHGLLKELAEAKERIKQLEAQTSKVPDGMTPVPTEILDNFPELNEFNYSHDDVCELNAWGVELVLAAAPSPAAPAPKEGNSNEA